MSVPPTKEGLYSFLEMKNVTRRPHQMLCSGCTKALWTEGKGIIVILKTFWYATKSCSF